MEETYKIPSLIVKLRDLINSSFGTEVHASRMRLRYFIQSVAEFVLISIHLISGTVTLARPITGHSVEMTM